MDNKYTKLSNLVNDKFTINKVGGYTFKMWSAPDKRMISRDTYAEGFRKVYEVETDKGKLDLGTGQIGTLLEATFKDGQADLNGKTFEVKSNGKTGMDIRYYFNEVKDFAPEPSVDERGDDSAKDETDLGDIPF